MPRSDTTPLPAWKQWWNRTGNQRRDAAASVKSMVTALASLVISVLGATLISFGVYSVYPPAGFIVAGGLVWLLQWSHEVDRKGKA